MSSRNELSTPNYARRPVFFESDMEAEKAEVRAILVKWRAIKVLHGYGLSLRVSQLLAPLATWFGVVK